nr:sulfite exporter TauE/SafE family protein [Oceanococcus sp. HetDA_MAG_MS8]
MLSLTDLSLPALALAGVQTSAHCVLMCGAMNAAQPGRQWAWWQMHLGRLLSYTLLGALAGGVGGWLLLQLPEGLANTTVRISIGLAVVALGVLHICRQQSRPVQGCAVHQQTSSRWPPWLLGIAWGLVPCPVLYAALFIASLSASVAQGAALMAAFGLGTLPLFLIQGQVFKRLWQRLQQAPTRRGWWITACGVGLMVTAVWMPAGLVAYCR